MDQNVSGRLNRVGFAVPTDWQKNCNWRQAVSFSFRTGFGIRSNPQNSPPPALLEGVLDPSVSPEVWGWFPEFDFPTDFGRGCAIRLAAYRTRAGDRVFLPVDGWEGLVNVAGAVGIAVGKQTGLDRNVTRPYAVMMELHQYARRTREFHSRRFQCRHDLRLRQPERGLVLPPGFCDGTCDPTDRPKRAMERFLAAGRAAAVRRGIAKPTTAQSIAAALHEAAVRNPCHGTNRPHTAVRAALFKSTPLDNSLPPAPVEATYREYSKRFRTRVREGLDASTEAFRAWHGGAKTNLPRHVGGQVTRESGIDAATARAALVDLCWRSFAYAGAVVSVAMSRWLAKARAAGKLTDREERLFRLLYCRNLDAGGFPLAVLHDRLDVLEPWIAAIVSEPDRPTDWPVFFALLVAYAYMSDARLETDARERIRRFEGGTTDERDVPERGRHGGAAADGGLESADLLAVVGERMRGTLGVSCNCGGTWKPDIEQVNRGVRFRFTCTCGHIEERCVGVAAVAESRSSCTRQPVSHENSSTSRKEASRTSPSRRSNSARVSTCSRRRAAGFSVPRTGFSGMSRWRAAHENARTTAVTAPRAWFGPHGRRPGRGKRFPSTHSVTWNGASEEAGSSAGRTGGVRPLRASQNDWMWARDHS